MRRRVAVLAFASSFSPALSACISSSPGGPPAATLPDGAVVPGDGSVSLPPGVDAASFDVFVPHDAGGDSTLPDGALPDAEPTDGIAPTDAPADTAPADSGPDTFDAGPPPVVVTVLGQLGPEQGVTIVFDGPSGAAGVAVVTDVTGTASAPVPPGGMVTALLGSLGNRRLVTVFGVSPGDQLVAFDPTIYAQVSVGAAPSPPQGTTSYQASAGRCGGGFQTPPGSFPLDQSCVSGGTFPVLLVADNGGTPVGFTFLKGNPVAPALDGGDLLTPPGPWATTFGSTALQMTNVTQSAANLVAYFSEVAGGVPSVTMQDANSVDDAGTASNSFVTHPGYPDFVQGEVQVILAGFGGNGPLESIATRAAPGTAALTFDLSQLLPQITSAQVVTDADAGASTSQPIVTWTASGSLASTAGIFAGYTWFENVDGGQNTGSWTFVAPSTMTAVPTPALPSVVAAWAPQSGATFTGPPLFAAVAGTAIPDLPLAQANRRDHDGPSYRRQAEPVRPAAAEGWDGDADRLRERRGLIAAPSSLVDERLGGYEKFRGGVGT